jgi:hypothetical protein
MARFQAIYSSDGEYTGGPPVKKLKTSHTQQPPSTKRVKVPPRKPSRISASSLGLSTPTPSFETPASYTLHADMLDSTPFTLEPSGLLPVSLSPTPVGPTATPGALHSQSAASPSKRDSMGAETHHREKKMPRMPFQSIDLTQLRIQNSTVTPARKPAREQEKESRRKRATRERSEKELRRARQQEREVQERLEKERQKGEEQEEASREEAERVKALQERADEFWEKINKPVAEGGFGAKGHDEFFTVLLRSGHTRNNAVSSSITRFMKAHWGDVVNLGWERAPATKWSYLSKEATAIVNGEGEVIRQVFSHPQKSNLTKLLNDFTLDRSTKKMHHIYGKSCLKVHEKMMEGAMTRTL